MLSEALKAEECWTYIKPFRFRKDGRSAFRTLWNQFLGSDNLDTQATKAERILDTLEYQGEKRDWNFETYARQHKEQHTILDGLKTHGYAGIDKETKVRKLLRGIKTSALDAVKAQVLAISNLQGNFDRVVQLYRSFIVQQTLTYTNIRAVNEMGATNMQGMKPALMDNEIDRYYTKEEWYKLPKAKKIKIMDA